MPRKPKLEKKTVIVNVDGVPVSVVLHPPTGLRTSWYAYWAGLVSSRSSLPRNCWRTSAPGVLRPKRSREAWPR